MKYRVRPWWLACALLAGLLAACAAPSKPATTVTFMIFGDPAEQAAFKSVVDGFHASTSAVHVEIIAVPSQGDYMTRLAADVAAGSPPDVFLLNYRRMAQFYNAGTLEALGPRLQASDKLSEDQYYAVALDAFRSANGTLICIPQNISSQVVYYNKDMFDAAALPYPDPNWDWKSFRQTAAALTQPDRNGDGEPDQYGLGLEPRLIRTAAFIWQNGGELVDDPAQPARLTLDTPEAIEAIEFMMSLSLKDQVVPNKTSEMVQSHGDRFLSGNIAMYVDSRRIVPAMREVAKFNWDVAPLPRSKYQATVLHSDGYCLAKASKVQDAAWAFIEFAMGEEGQKRASQLGRTVPSLKSVAESPAYLDPAQPPAHPEVWLDAMAYLHVLPRVENWVAIERTADTEFELVYLGLQPLSTAIENVQRQSRQGFVPLGP
jgi:multiple sugar transport system substrate-binding protein